MQNRVDDDSIPRHRLHRDGSIGIGHGHVRPGMNGEAKLLVDLARGKAGCRNHDYNQHYVFDALFTHHCEIPATVVPSIIAENGPSPSHKSCSFVRTLPSATAAHPRPRDCSWLNLPHPV